MLTEIEVEDFTEFEKRIYELANGEYIFIWVSGNDVHVELIDKPAVDFISIGTIGSFEFDQQPEDVGPETIYRTKVLHMDLSGFGGRYKCKGIGEEIIKLKKRRPESMWFLGRMMVLEIATVAI